MDFFKKLEEHGFLDPETEDYDINQNLFFARALNETLDDEVFVLSKEVSNVLEYHLDGYGDCLNQKYIYNNDSLNIFGIKTLRVGEAISIAFPETECDVISVRAKGYKNQRIIYKDDKRLGEKLGDIFDEEIKTVAVYKPKD